ncbi:MAG: hypothetical protein ACYDAN_01345 [Candidatus Limnocylindrales bacterium]
MTATQRKPLATRGSEVDARDSPRLEYSAVAVTRRAGAAARVRVGVSAVRRGVVGLIARAPATVRATRTAARGTVGALQTLPDSTLQALAATSVGLGVGLSFTRARRLAFVAGMLPAVLIRAVIAARPVKPRAPGDAGA